MNKLGVKYLYTHGGAVPLSPLKRTFVLDIAHFTFRPMRGAVLHTAFWQKHQMNRGGVKYKCTDINL